MTSNAIIGTPNRVEKAFIFYSFRSTSSSLAVVEYWYTDVQKTMTNNALTGSTMVAGGSGNIDRIVGDSHLSW